MDTGKLIESLEADRDVFKARADKFRTANRELRRQRDELAECLSELVAEVTGMRSQRAFDDILKRASELLAGG